MIEDRKSSRKPLLAARIHGELRYGASVRPALLLNESSDGFGVLVGGLPAVSANQKVQLRTDCGWFQCRVIHVAQVAPSRIFPDADLEYEPVPVGDPMVGMKKDILKHDDTLIRKELFQGDGTIVRNDLYQGDIAVIPTDANGREVSEEGVDDAFAMQDDGAKYITSADIKAFTADKEGPWFRVGILRLKSIAQPPLLACSPAGTMGGIRSAQWIASVLASLIHH